MLTAVEGNSDSDKSNTGKVKVFILAGQSNMEGKAPNALLEYQATNEKTTELYAHLRKNDHWIERDDVFIKFLERHGPLTIGYGSPKRTGVELEFGTCMGDHFAEPVILIKAAYGGHSLTRMFRPPSRPIPSDDDLLPELEKIQARVKNLNEKHHKQDPLPTLADLKEQYGSSYRHMIEEVKDVQTNYASLFPELTGKTLELSGFVWFQGWSDQYGSEHEYAENMEHFIRDVRHDLQAPTLPFVIGVMGQNGSREAKGALLTVQQAQLSMNDIADFKGNVKAIRTDVFVDKDAEALYPNWKEHLEQWNTVGGDRGFHYLGSAIWFNRIGKAMGEAMLELLAQQ